MINASSDKCKTSKLLQHDNQIWLQKISMKLIVITVYDNLVSCVWCHLLCVLQNISQGHQNQLFHNFSFCLRFSLSSLTKSLMRDIMVTNPGTNIPLISTTQKSGEDALTRSKCHQYLVLELLVVCFYVDINGLWSVNSHDLVYFTTSIFIVDSWQLTKTNSNI